MSDEPNVIVPACEDFATIAARLQEILDWKQCRREQPAPAVELDYTGFDGS